MTLEADIEKEFVELCRQAGYLALKLTPPNVRGFPDRTVLLPGGHVVFVEFKTPTGQLSKHQDEWIEKLVARGQWVIVTTDARETFNVIRGTVT